MNALVRKGLVYPAIFASGLAVWATATGNAQWSPQPPAAVAASPMAVPAPLPMDLAHEYAARHGLTACVAPADAALDSVFLTVPVDAHGQPAGDTIYRADLDTALDSAGKRLVLVGCSAPTKGM